METLEQKVTDEQKRQVQNLSVALHMSPTLVLRVLSQNNFDEDKTVDELLTLAYQEKEKKDKEETEKKQKEEAERLENELRLKEDEKREEERRQKEEEIKQNELERKQKEDADLKQKMENERIEREEAERKEVERKEAERKEVERKEAERKEAEKKEVERKEAERKEVERKEAERKEVEIKEEEIKLRNQREEEERRQREEVERKLREERIDLERKLKEEAAIRETYEKKLKEEAAKREEYERMLKEESAKREIYEKLIDKIKEETEEKTREEELKLLEDKERKLREEMAEQERKQKEESDKKRKEIIEIPGIDINSFEDIGYKAPMFTIWCGNHTAKTMEEVKKIRILLGEINVSSSDVSEIDIQTDDETKELLDKEGGRWPVVFLGANNIGVLERIEHLVKTGEMKEKIEQYKSQEKLNALINDEEPQPRTVDKILNHVEYMTSYINPVSWLKWASAPSPLGETVDFKVLHKNWYYRELDRIFKFGDTQYYRMHPEYPQPRATYKYTDINRLTILNTTQLLITYKNFNPDLIRCNPNDLDKIVQLIMKKEPSIVLEDQRKN